MTIFKMNNSNNLDMKQTVEEAARENILFNHRTVDRTLIGKDLAKFGEMNFVQGAEWQSKQSLWISVKERLPENEDRVLVLCKMKRFNSYFTLVNNYIDGEWETKILAHYDTVAWMPIPSFDEILESNRDVLERIKEKGD